MCTHHTHIHLIKYKMIDSLAILVTCSMVFTYDFPYHVARAHLDFWLFHIN